MLQTILLFFKATSENPSKERVQQFVDENFSEEGTEFEEWTPTDWIPEPAMLNKIQVSNISFKIGRTIAAAFPSFKLLWRGF